jgi:DNA invertase Pin-like site-specific DNA recombinase
VWKLDRLSRSLRDVLTIRERLSEMKAGFRSLTEAIDTTTPAGRMMMQMVGTFAEFERAMLRERTKSGLRNEASEQRLGYSAVARGIPIRLGARLSEPEKNPNIGCRVVSMPRLGGLHHRYGLAA